MATSPRVRKPRSQQYSKNCFWYKRNAKKVEGVGTAEAGPATLQTQIMAILSGAQLRWVEVLLLPEDLQALPGVGCRAATSVPEETVPNS